jgi:hypothetical protein
VSAVRPVVVLGVPRPLVRGSVVRVGGGAVVWVLIENARTKYF